MPPSSRLVLGAAAFLTTGLVVLPQPAHAATPITVPFAYTGNVQTWTVPAGVHAVTVIARGAQGGNVHYLDTLEASGGLGARTVATVPVAPGDELKVLVGGSGQDSVDGVVSGTGGFNGGGRSQSLGRGAGGGGASDVRGSAGTLDSRLAVAAGGGGAGFGTAVSNPVGGRYGAAGAGGDSGAPGNNGGNATNDTAFALGGTGGQPGTSTAGGVGGHSGIFYLTDSGQGGPGALGVGGAPVAKSSISDGQPVSFGGGGGGGGWYGGGAGGYGARSEPAFCGCFADAGGGGGAGGSSDVVPEATNTAIYQGVGQGDGYVSLTYFPGDSTPVDTTAPTVAVEQASAQADPTADGPITFDVTFSEQVTGFDSSDVTVTGTAGATSATVTGSGATYTATVAAPASAGTVIANVAAGVAQDAAGNLSTASSSTDNTVTFTIAPPPDTIAPSVTINQSATQTDPTSSPTAKFDVVFSETVTDFTQADVLAGGTAPGGRTVAVTGSGTTYEVSLSGATGSGTLTASVPAGGAHDAAGNANTASTSTDNTVTYQAPPPPDTTAPSISCAANPAIWTKPPNHSLLPISIMVNATDNRGPVSVSLVSVTSSQADRGLGKDDLGNDIQGWTAGTDDRSGLVRAERFKTDRVYTYTYRATDGAGNTTQCSATTRVTVGSKGKDKGKGK